MTYKDFDKAWEEYRRIAADFPKLKIVMAQQPEPARRWSLPQTPTLLIVDDLYLLKK
jgi:hypothetical protein